MSLLATLVGYAQAEPDPSGLTVVQAVLLFVGAPLAAVALVSAGAIAAERRRQRSGTGIDPRHPAGIEPNPATCVVTRDAEGGEIHDDTAPADARRRTVPCWRVRCATCGCDYREDGELVHFAGAELAFTVIRARGWDVKQEQVRCPACT